MIKQSKHWLTGLLMAAMVLSLTGCASVSAPTGNNQSADSSSSAKAVSHQRAQKKYADTKTSKASQSSSQTSQSISSSAAAATSSSLDGETVQSSDAAVQKAEPATSAAQTAVSQLLQMSQRRRLQRLTIRWLMDLTKPLVCSRKMATNI